MNTMVTIQELQRTGVNPMAVSRSVKKQQLGNYGYDFYQTHPNVLAFDEDAVMIKIHALLKPSSRFPRILPMVRFFAASPLLHPHWRTSCCMFRQKNGSFIR
ncbi:MAG: hypothetical protein ACI4QP_03400 [Candidatus Enteromonas sp.]